MDSIFIRKHVFDWNLRADHGTYRDQAGWDKPYEYLELAYDILAEHRKDIGRIDVLSNLQRAIDHRIKRISTIYSFKAMNSFGFPKEYVERLEVFGLIKPLMIDAIFKIRNQIEHHYHEPPDRKRCNELADFVWYFLKATDGCARYLIEGMILEHDYETGYSSAYWIAVNLRYPYDWKKVDVYGWLHPEDICFDSDEGIEIVTDRITYKSSADRPKDPDQAEVLDCLDANSVNFSGSIYLTKENAGSVIRTVFKADVHI